MAESVTKPTDGAAQGAAKGATMALVLLTAMNFVNYLDRYILFAVQEPVKHEFGLSDAQVGSLTLWFMVAYVGASPITGWLGDRFPRKPMIVTTALIIAAMNFLTAYVHDYASLNFRHAALGIGEASFGIFAPALLADFYAEDQRNRVLTIFNIALPVGAAASFEMGSWIASHYGWRMSFVSSAVPGVLVALLILAFLKEPKHARLQSESSDGTSSQGSQAKKTYWFELSLLLKNPAYLCAILGFAAITFSLGGITAWISAFLQRVGGYSQQAAGGVMGPIIVVAGFGGTALGGWIAQVWSRKTSKALYFVPGISAVLTIPPAVVCFFGPRALMVPSLSVAVFLVFLGTGPINAATLNAVPANLRATAMAGQLFALHIFGDMFSPTFIGMISDRSNLRYGLAATLVTFAIAGVIFFFGARYAPELHHGVEPPQAA